ncbi:DUF202 domain-containing protein [Demequina sp. NBRC 110055]|uniref:DUF202 domain-containing protein n=1 Tax=Demequina sp. NBRC 110055 TaxID=1570344 RepID=UPI00118652EC|nr:DUF202 domain-containing protein [Demequina sp. NBRC 110055]
MTVAVGEGLQPERTALAWRRTILAIAAGTAIAGRYLGAGSTWLGMVLPLGALVGGGILLALTTRRLHAFSDALDAPAQAGRHVPMPTAVVLAVLAGACLAIGVGAAVFIVAT